MLWLLYKLQRYRTARIRIGRAALVAEIADTPIKRVIGLMYRDAMPARAGMLFVFGTPGRHGIWMYKMRFPIDVFWLDARSMVVDVAEGMAPCVSITACAPRVPRRNASYVIETRAGIARRYRIGIGSVAALGQAVKGGAYSQPQR